MRADIRQSLTRMEVSQTKCIHQMNCALWSSHCTLEYHQIIIYNTKGS